jgi:hypothetical protein
MLDQLLDLEVQHTVAPQDNVHGNTILKFRCIGERS